MGVDVWKHTQVWALAGDKMRLDLMILKVFSNLSNSMIL